MLQASIQSLICSYVFNELPKIYKKVCVVKPKPLEGELKKNQPTPSKPTVKCDKCHFKSNMIQMKLHIKNIHIKKSARASKRLPAFTPVAKPSKRTKPEPHNKVNMTNIINIDDDSILLSPDAPAIFDATNLEEMVSDSISTEDNLLPKSNEISDQIEPISKCCVCEYKANDKSEIKDHEMTQHAMTKCSNCDVTIFETLLKNHMAENHSVNHSDNKGGDGTMLDEKEGNEENNVDLKDDAPSFICGQCGLFFTVEEECTRHMATHNHKCLKCDFESTSIEEIARHENKYHVTYTESTHVDSNQVHMENATFYCERCGNSFEEFGLLAKHSMDKYGEPLGISCTFCGDALADKDQLEKHKEDVHNTEKQTTKRHTDFRCALCQKIIRTNIGIQRHSQLFCEQCKKCSPERTTFDLHMGAHLRCDECKLTFNSELDLERHIEKGHEPNPSLSHKCINCSFAGNNENELTLHSVDTHSFRCVQCEEVFNSSYNLRLHNLTNHRPSVTGKDEGTKSINCFECDQCQFKANNVPALLNTCLHHIRKIDFVHFVILRQKNRIN